MGIVDCIGIGAIVITVSFLLGGCWSVGMAMGANEDDKRCPDCHSLKTKKMNIRRWGRGHGTTCYYDIRCGECGRFLESTFGQLTYKEIKEWEDAESK